MKRFTRILPLAAAALFFMAAAPSPVVAGGYGHGHHYYGHGHHYRPHFYPRHHHYYGHRPHSRFSFTYVQRVAPPPVVIREYRTETVTYDQPPPQPAYSAPPVVEGAPSTCLMTREYQTEIAVGGRLVPGYGQACLQPDGSWYRGPAVPAAY